MVYGKLLVVSAGEEREFMLEKEAVTIGRAADNDIVLANPAVSRHHARLTATSEGTVLEDLGSTYGTMVGEEKVSRRVLRSGDLISLASVRLRFEAPRREETGQRTIVDLVAQKTNPALEEAALKATITHTLLDVSAEVAKEASRQDATFQVVLADQTKPRLVVRDEAPSRPPFREVRRDGASEEGISRDVPLGQDTVLIGRGVACQVSLTSRCTSRRHAEVRPQDGGYVLVDLGSTNGTIVNGQPITAPHPLADGDLIAIGKALLVYKAGAPTAPPRAARPRGRRPVVLIPGFMGSELRRGSLVLWPNYPYLLSNPAAIMPDSGPVEVSGVIHETVVVPHFIKIDAYNRLSQFLEKSLGYRLGVDLLEFPYDWRQDNRQTAQQLATTIRTWRERMGHGPVTIIAHSMGGLVTRYYLDQLGGKEHVERFVAIGTPHFGSPRGMPPVLHGPGAAPFGLASEKIRTLLLSAPSVYQVFPRYPCVFDRRGEPLDVFADESWLAPEYRAILRAAAEFFAALSPQPRVPTLCIFGYGQPTTSRVIVDRRETGWEMLRYEITPTGDETVPEESAILEGSDLHPVRQRHGALFTDPDVQRRLRYELVERRVA
jgi:pSer/pThr/pTyr-binding forkhead associated (FHA) protein